MNIYQLPQVNETHNTLTHNRLTIGDSHGNTMKIIFSLFHLGFATFPEDAEQNYARLAEIYQKNPEALTKKDLTDFKYILQKMEINTDATLCLIGDILHDRGNNDYFTLLLLKQLKEKNAKVDIIFSNHDKRFLTLYLNHETYGSETVASINIPSTIANIFNLQKKSVIGLGKLINRALINRSAVDDLIKECYLPQLKLIDYALDEKGDLTIYSHAPVDLRAIKFLAKQLDVPYVDNSTTTLALTIELINREFQTIKAQPEKLKQLLAIDNNADVYTPEAPINAIAWNKEITDLNRCDLRIGENTIKFTHGHNGDTQNSKEQNFVTNLDYHNELGHGQVPNNHHLNETNQQFRCERLS